MYAHLRYFSLYTFHKKFPYYEIRRNRLKVFYVFTFIRKFLRCTIVCDFFKRIIQFLRFIDGTIFATLSRRNSYHRSSSRPSKFKSKRRQTFHSGHNQRRSLLPMHFEVAEVFEKPVSNLSVPRIIPQRNYSAASRHPTHAQRLRLQVKLFLFSLWTTNSKHD